MFTGIVQAMGMVVALTPRGGDVEIVVDTGDLGLADAVVGDSIAVAGACLTATRLDGSRFAADVSNETLSKTTLGRLRPGSRVNLEKALRAGQALGGHYVTGHVDGVGRVVESREDGRSWRVVFEVPEPLARYVAPKGSITVEGVSLTVNEVEGARFGVNLIPHTREVTTLGELVEGSPVNLEVDIIARYVERLLAASR
ncbi:MAG: riboflavin synthase [Steroidobacteraceae bacterium]|jgi:riboflavin synthase|nr:riboflavin synthase [Steroidobacteraceae bacterium]